MADNIIVEVLEIEIEVLQSPAITIQETAASGGEQVVLLPGETVLVEQGNSVNIGNFVLPAYAHRADDQGDVSYYGEAEVGTLNSEALWRIKRVTLVGGVLTTEWAGSQFNQIWDNRTGLTYG